jgi:hypothetical protein
MLVSSLTTLGQRRSFGEATQEIWSHPQVRRESVELLELLRDRVEHVQTPLELSLDIPLRVHARYTRTEVLAAIGSGTGAKPPTWQTGVWWDPDSQTDLFAFTLDKSVGGFSPTTRYRDYAISPHLMHWESQSATSTDSETGRRYINHIRQGTGIVLFARLRTDDRAFWCLGRATYVRHEGDRPIAFVWQLEHKLPADLFATFAAAVA